MSSPRIAIYGLGFVGQQLAKLTLDKGFKLVAAFNRSGEKVGQDVGALLGLDRDIGVLVEDCEIADYTNLQADMIFIATCDRLHENMSAYERLLNAGVNVLCHGTESYHPRWANAELAELIDALAKANGVTFCGSGIWDMTRMWSGIIAAGPCVEITAMHHSSQTDLGRQGLHHMPRMGVGMTVDEFRQTIGAGRGSTRGHLLIPLVVVLEKLGYTVTDTSERMEPIVWDKPYYCEPLGQELAAGTCVGTRVCLEVHTSQGVTAYGNVEYRVFNPGEEETMRWKIEGRPGFDICVTRQESGLASASSLFNRCQDVLQAPPGIQPLWTFGPMHPDV